PALEAPPGSGRRGAAHVLRRPDRAAALAAARGRHRRRRETPRTSRPPRLARARRRLRRLHRGGPLMDVWPGRPFPLGATWDGHGTNFSLFSENAERVQLCLFDGDGSERRIDVTEHTVFNW